MKATWDWRPLGEVCKTGSGATPLKTIKEYYDGGMIPWLLSGEVAQGEITEAKNFITEVGLKNSAAKLFPENSVLIAMYGATAGQVGILRFESATNQAVCAILPNPSFVPEFLFYIFLHLKERLIATATGNAQPNISQIKIKSTVIPVPPLAEQRRIVAVLDKAFAGIATATANAQKNLTNARTLFESYLNFLLSNRDESWINSRLGSVATLQRGFDLPTQDREPGEVPLISSSGVIARVSEARVQGPGVTTGRSGSIGNVFYIAEPYWPLNTSLYVKDFHGNDPRFVFWLLKNFNLGKYATGSGVPTLNRNFVHEEEVRLPGSREAQLEIGLKLDKFDFECSKLEALTTKKIAALSELKQSLLQKAFAGELT